jgi:hypothetical protein
VGQTEKILAQFMRRIAQAAGEAARDLEASAGDRRETLQRRLDRLNLGIRQTKIVRLAGLRSDRGMSVSEIAKGIKKSDMPNMYSTLDALQNRGVLERVPGATPRRYRLAAPYRTD